MEKTTYYYQIEKEGVAWERTPFFIARYKRRGDAVRLAKEIAEKNNRKVRMTDNDKLLQGSYFHPSITV